MATPSRWIARVAFEPGRTRVVEELEDENNQSGGGSGNLQWAAGNQADEEAADNACDDAGLGRQTAGLGDADAKRQRHHEDHER